jgi:hypothetical protein
VPPPIVYVTSSKYEDDPDLFNLSIALASRMAGKMDQSHDAVRTGDKGSVVSDVDG